MNIEQFWEIVNENKKDNDSIKLNLKKGDLHVIWGYIDMARRCGTFKDFQKTCSKPNFQKILKRIDLTKKELRSLMNLYKAWLERPDSAFDTP